jgi:hypothetical protein
MFAQLERMSIDQKLERLEGLIVESLEWAKKY